MPVRSYRLPYNPERALGEVLGIRARLGADPEASEYRCPYIHVPCPKRSQKLPNNPYPVCTLWRSQDDDRTPENDLIFVCPKRFYARDFLAEVIEHCWPEDNSPGNPRVAPEVKMDGFGNVDFVIADVGENGEINQFLSVELQAIDITGSVVPAYVGLLEGEYINRRPTYGFNWDNVYKRYITQLIRKGYFHHHWGTKIVAVIPEQVYRYIKERADFLCTPLVRQRQVNIVFMTYRLEDDPDRPGEYRPALTTVEGTSHSNLQSAILYKDAPQREAFAARINHSLQHRAVDLADLIALGALPIGENDLDGDEVPDAE